MRKAPFKRVALVGQQRRLWEDSLAAFSWVGPGFAHITYSMLHNSGHPDLALFTNDIESAAATDGYQLILRPDRFFAYDLMERVFILLHEVMHETLDHVRIGWFYRKAGRITFDGKSLPYDHDYANVMQDLVINAILVACKMGKFNKDWLLNTTIATDNDHWVELYFRHWEDRKVVTMPGGFDIHLDPSASQGEEPEQVPERNRSQWEIVIKAAQEIQRAQGKLPLALEHFFDGLLRPRVDWTEHIRGQIQRLTGSGAYDWRRLDRRLITRGIGAPSLTGNGAGLVVIGGDTSMSVFRDKTLIHRWLGELVGIMEDVQPEECRVLWCDITVRRADICKDPQDVLKMAYKGVPGGGGTDFVPVFDYIRDNDLQPDVLLYLTDGDGKFPTLEPEFPVIWGDISGSPEKYPFGTVVQIPIHRDTAE